MHDRVSADARGFRITLVPSAVVATRRARMVCDFEAGMRILPERRDGVIVAVTEKPLSPGAMVPTLIAPTVP
jgi:hypothetical protein